MAASVMAIASVTAIMAIAMAVSIAELQRDPRTAVLIIVSAAAHAIAVRPVAMTVDARPMISVHLLHAALC